MRISFIIKSPENKSTHFAIDALNEYNKITMENSNKNKLGSITTTCVFLVFLILKLAGIGLVANWPWWWVFSPFWMPAGLVLILWLVFTIYARFCSSKKFTEPPISPKYKSKFQQRIEEMEKQRNELKNKNK